jgi:hypothetical protein
MHYFNQTDSFSTSCGKGCGNYLIPRLNEFGFAGDGAETGSLPFPL